MLHLRQQLGDLQDVGMLRTEAFDQDRAGLCEGALGGVYSRSRVRVNSRCAAGLLVLRCVAVLRLLAFLHR